MVLFFSWPFLMLYGIGWLLWQTLRALGYSFYYIGWFVINIFLPAVIFLLALIVFCLVKWLFPALSKRPQTKEPVPPVWRGWTPPKDSE